MASNFKSRAGVKRGCPQCASSKLEKLMTLILKDLGLDFTPQKRFDECRHIKPLAFDFFLEKENILLELDGLQHFEKVYFGGYDSPGSDLELQRKLDGVKNVFAGSSKKHLLRISFSEISKLREHFVSFLEDCRKSTLILQRFVGKEYESVKEE